MSNDTWIDAAKETPPPRTTVAAVLKGPRIATVRYAIGPNKKGFYQFNGTNISPDQVVAWCHLPQIPDWAKGTQLPPVQYKTPDDVRKGWAKYDNDQAEAKMTKAPLHVR